MKADPRLAAAKINLNLHVTGQRADGYHVLDSIVAFAQIGDRLWFEPADTLTLDLTGPFGGDLLDEENNLIMRAAQVFETAGRGAKITLEKNLPLASGIGGGSADAAAAMHGLSGLWGLPLPDLETQLLLGADVPVCLTRGPQRMRGIGNWIEPVHWLPDLPVVLVNPGVQVSTPEVFAKLDRRSNRALPALPKRRLPPKDAIAWLAETRNDLESPAISLFDDIKEVLEALSARTLLARMSGSGATCFGICKDMQDAQDVCSALQRRFPRWWCQATMLCGHQRPPAH